MTAVNATTSAKEVLLDLDTAAMAYVNTNGIAYQTLRKGAIVTPTAMSMPSINVALEDSATLILSWTTPTGGSVIDAGTIIGLKNLMISILLISHEEQSRRLLTYLFIYLDLYFSQLSSLSLILTFSFPTFLLLTLS